MKNALDETFKKNFFNKVGDSGQFSYIIMDETTDRSEIQQ